MKKNLLRYGIAFTILSVILIGCAASNGNGKQRNVTPEVEPGTIGSVDKHLILAAQIAREIDAANKDVILFYHKDEADYSEKGLWMWNKQSNGGQESYDATKGKAIVKEMEGKKIAYWNISQLTETVSAINESIRNNEDINFIIRDEVWNKDPGIDQEMNITEGKHFMVLSGNDSVYQVKDNYTPMILSANAVDASLVKISLSAALALQTVPDSNNFVITDEAGNMNKVIDVVNNDYREDREKNYTNNLLLKVSDALDPCKNYFISHKDFNDGNKIAVNTLKAVKNAAAYNGDDLGLTVKDSALTFKTWAPLASEVNLLVYGSVSDVGNFNSEAVKSNSLGATTDKELYGNPLQKISMKRNHADNTWFAQLPNKSEYKYYKYEIINNGTTYYVCDIWSKASSPESIATQIVDINKTPDAIPESLYDKSYGTVEGYYNPQSAKYDSSVIYEMHISDWSMAENSSYTENDNVGKYLTIANGTKVIQHLKDVGVTHVQLLPVFEFAETNTNTDYNWGYNPYNYNVPEGRYVTTGYKEGTQAVAELRTLIARLHEAGIAVNMDVVYNHTSSTGSNSLYDSTVPSYFYRMTDGGEYSNGSGCGNEIDSEAAMATKFILDSLKHWMLDYHVNGFRFDLMGCLSKDTMKLIYDELSAIDPNVMIYGEPWTGGTSLVENGTSSAIDSHAAGYGVAVFDDDFRDAIKGAEFGGFKRGQVQDVNSDDEICKGLTGKSGKNNRNVTPLASLGIRYAECHDNYTLFDKLAISRYQDYKGLSSDSTIQGNLFSKEIIGEDGLEKIKQNEKLASAYLILSQGTLFINGGQEFMRTKNGNENSYNVSNTKSSSVNGIDLQFKEKFSDVYNTYRALISLRKSYPAEFGANTKAVAETVSRGVTKYSTGKFVIYYNASEDPFTISENGRAVEINQNDGTFKISESISDISLVNAKNYVIINK